MASDTTPSRPIGSFLSILPETRAVAPEPNRPGWVRITEANRTLMLATDAIVGVERLTPRPVVEGDEFGPGHTFVITRAGSFFFIGDVDPQDVLHAMDQADDEGPGAATPGLWAAPADLAERIVARRNMLAGAASLAEAVEVPPILGLLRDQALCLAKQASHPRDLLLLVRDAAREAAAELLNGDSPLAADRFLALANQLERDAYRVPAGAPPA